MMATENTISGKDTPRFLGAAFVFVFAASLISGVLGASAVGAVPLEDPGSISDVLVNVSNNVSLMRISILMELANSLGIIALAVLLYVALRRENNILALVALGWWLAEAVVLAVSKMGAFALIPLSQQFVAAGAPESSYFQALGDFLYYGVDRTGYDLLMMFFCLGAIVWYSLFYRSRVIPRVLAGWGLGAVLLVTIGTLVGLYDRSLDLPTALYVPYIPFELFIGIWLMVKGFNAPAAASETARPAIHAT